MNFLNHKELKITKPSDYKIINIFLLPPTEKKYGVTYYKYADEILKEAVETYKSYFTSPVLFHIETDFFAIESDEIEETKTFITIISSLLISNLQTETAVSFREKRLDVPKKLHNQSIGITAFMKFINNESLINELSIEFYDLKDNLKGVIF